MKIEECEFSIRTHSLLKLFQIYDLQKLSDYSAEELLSKSYFGKKCLQEVRKILSHHGMHLRGDLLANSEEQKKLIENIPNLIREISVKIYECKKELNLLNIQLEKIFLDLSEKGIYETSD